MNVDSRFAAAATGDPSALGPRRLVIVGEVRLYRDGLAQALAREASIEVVGTATGGSAAVRLLSESDPDIVLVDLILGGLELVRSLRRKSPRLRVVALAVRDDEEEVVACAEAGVAGYVTRDGSLDDLLRVLDSASRSEALVSPRMTAALMRRVASLASSRRPREELDTLTAREREVIELVAAGLTNKEIARALHIELPTVKNHMHHILEKLHVRRRSEAVARLREGDTGRI